MIVYMLVNLVQNLKAWSSAQDNIFVRCVTEIQFLEWIKLLNQYLKDEN